MANLWHYSLFKLRASKSNSKLLQYPCGKRGAIEKSGSRKGMSPIGTRHSWIWEGNNFAFFSYLGMGSGQQKTNPGQEEAAPPMFDGANRVIVIAVVAEKAPPTPARSCWGKTTQQGWHLRRLLLLLFSFCFFSRKYQRNHGTGRQAPWTVSAESSYLESCLIF